MQFKKKNTATDSSVIIIVESETTVNLIIETKHFNYINSTKSHLFEIYQVFKVDDNDLFQETCNKINSFEAKGTNSSKYKKDFPNRSNKSRTKFLNFEKRSNRVSSAAQAPKTKKKSEKVAAKV